MQRSFLTYKMEDQKWTWSSGLGSPERTIVVVFSLHDRRKKRIFVISNVVSSMGEKAFVNNVEVPDPQTTIILGLANVLPRAKSNRGGRIVILDTRPPKPSNNGVDFFNKDFREKDSGHIYSRLGWKQVLI